MLGASPISEIAKNQHKRPLIDTEERPMNFKTVTIARNAFAYLETVESAKARELGKQGGIILPIDHDRSPLSDGGYTAWVTLHDETIFLVQYITDDAPRPQILGYWFRESDF